MPQNILQSQRMYSGSGVPHPLSRKLKYEVTSPSDPSGNAVSTSLDTTYDVCRSVFIGSGGNVELQLADSGSITFKNVDDGTILPIRAARVSGSSTASDIRFLY